MTPVAQIDFGAALLAPDLPVPKGLQDAKGRPAGRRFSVYRNNVAASLTEALHEGFPAIANLLGKENMDGLAGIFLRQHPPASPLMMHFGAEFPAFLAGMQQLSHLGYLPDVARLELALRRSYHAADATPIDPAQLGALTPEQLMQARLSLAPALILQRSNWPVVDLWRLATGQTSDKPRAAAQDLLITRPEFDPQVSELPKGAADWIAALQQGATIGAATETASAATETFTLEVPLTLLLQGSAITGLHLQG